MKKWIAAFRLRTLPLAFAGILLGSATGAFFGKFNWIVFLFATLTALSLQILSNLANDFGDFEKGTDNAQRVGPKRAMQSGAISKQEMKTALFIFTTISFILGILCLWFANLNATQYLIFLAIGIAAILAAIFYTIGKNAYGYFGFGDLFVFLFFGIVAVSGTAFLQSKSFNWQMLMPATSFGLLSVAVLNINNMRDIENDVANKKMTLAAKLGIEKAKQYHLFLVVCSIILTFLFTIFNFKSGVQWMFILICPSLISNALQTIRVKNSPDFNPFLGQLAKLSALFCLTFSIGLLLS